MKLDEWVESGRIPTWLLRRGIRRMLRQRLRELRAGGIQAQQQREQAWWSELVKAPIAVETQAANRQHYMVPAAFYAQVLGPCLKYSGSWFATPQTSLAQAELDTLQSYVDRAGLVDGMRVLDLGCGWGSLSLFIAGWFPSCQVLALSNSSSQRQAITAMAEQRGLTNLQVITSNISEFETAHRFDRVFSIEMFEHVRNYRQLLAKIARWLQPDGRLFVQVFAHREHSYPFEVEGSSNWLGRHFFTGGQMPAKDLLLRFQEDLVVLHQWCWNGSHYGRTAECWLANLDQHRALAERALSEAGETDSQAAVHRWRAFFLACAELFAYAKGEEWILAHYLFGHRGQFARGSS